MTESRAAACQTDQASKSCKSAAAAVDSDGSELCLLDSSEICVLDLPAEVIAVILSLISNNDLVQV